jgi:hypothetical protein
VGTNIITCTAEDEAGNDASDSITVTYSVPDLVITSPATLPSAVEDSTYGHQLVSTGGVAPITWSNNGAGTTLNDGDAQCAGLTLSSSGTISGTPTNAGTCSWTALATDSAADSDTQAFSITINAAGSAGPHTFFEQLCARGDVYQNTTDGIPLCVSLRPLAGQTSQSSPRWQNQLITYQQSPPGISAHVTYNPAGDTDPNKQDAAKVLIPPWVANIASLTGAIDADDTLIPIATSSDTINPYRKDRALKIDNEIMTVVQGPDGSVRSGNSVYVSRGRFGTTAASHSSGEDVQLGTNSLPTQLTVPIETPSNEEHTYLITWDVYMTSSFLGAAAFSGFDTHKTFQISSGNASRGTIWAEPRIAYNSGSACCQTAAFNPALHVGTINMRHYNFTCGPASYADSDGYRLGPNAHRDPLRPRSGGGCPSGAGAHNTFVVFPNRWTRIFVKIEVKVNDYDLISMYVNDEVQGTVTIFSGLQTSLDTRTVISDANQNSIRAWWAEYNTSVDSVVRPDFRNWVSYIRNLVVLEDVPSGDLSTILATKPVGGS